ncbi:hypothetical protein K1719_036137 [Acacia pycnantha]|nr:hypothetical protein K1719_036137 [Acacia pycnantha]
MSMDAVKRLTQQRSELCTQLQQVRGNWRREKTAHEKAVAAVRKTASDCFEMALAQIEYLNPGSAGCRSEQAVSKPRRAASGAGPNGDEAAAGEGDP